MNVFKSALAAKEKNMAVQHSNPLISIVIPLWNGAAYITETIESVTSQKQNTEILVINDGSTDESPHIVASLPCSLVTISHSGIARACNTGKNLAQGDYILFLDQDDVMCEGSLQALLKAFRHDVTLQAVSGQAKDFISPDLDTEEQTRLVLRPSPYYGLMSGSVLMRREVLDIVGDFNESYSAGQAVDYLLRIQQSGGSYAKIDAITVMRRLHATNTSRTMRGKQFGDYGTILRSKLGKALVERP